MESQKSKVIASSPLKANRVAFYMEQNGQRIRKVIAIENYYLDALSAMDIDRSQVAKWLSIAIEDYYSDLDADKRITQKLKASIVYGLIHYVFKEKKTGENMGLKQLDSAYKNLTQVDKKIFEAVPISEQWTITQIASELKRKQILNITFNQLVCRVKHLNEVGLVNSNNGFFSRQDIQGKTMKKTLDTKPTQESGIDCLVALSLDIEELIKKMQSVKKGIDDAVIDIDNKFKDIEVKSKNLNDLKVLLKGIVD